MPVQLNPQQLGSGSRVLENKAHDEAERAHQPEEFWSENCWYPLGWLGVRMPVVWSTALMLGWVEVRDTHCTCEPQLTTRILKWWEISLKCTFLIMLLQVSLELKRHWEVILFFSFGDAYYIYFSYTGLSLEINCKKNALLHPHQYIQCSTALALSSGSCASSVKYSCFPVPDSGKSESKDDIKQCT